MTDAWHWLTYGPGYDALMWAICIGWAAVLLFALAVHVERRTRPLRRRVVGIWRKLVREVYGDVG